VHRALTLTPVRALLPVAVAALLAACGGVQVKPTPNLPHPLLQPMSARVGVVLDEELRRYVHEETRGGTNWKVELGEGHEQFFREVISATFDAPQFFNNVADARAASGLQTIFRPRIEQFSFVTADETNGDYWAVTIRYSMAVLGMQGEIIDNYSLTGYGSARGGRAGTALTRATRAAMRDAAAKFLVQAPRQPLAKRLLAGEVLTPEHVEAAKAEAIEVVPIEEDPTP
jgi:hypothetical protein